MTLSPLFLNFCLHVLQPLHQLAQGEPRGSGTRCELTDQLIQPALPLDVIALQFLLCDECAGSLMGLEYAADLKLAVSPQYSIRVDGKIYRELPHRGQSIARRKRSRRDPAHDLIYDLAVDRNAAPEI
jgi:hypothetical protein